jgi:hypothetical protein
MLDKWPTSILIAIKGKVNNKIAIITRLFKNKPKNV